MAKVFLSLHVLAAILMIGPIAVAASLFPRYARSADGGAAVLHRICRGYAFAGLVVPVFGLATGSALGVLGDPWLIASVILTALAAGVLGAVILPGQARLLETGDGAARLAMMTGVFNLLWAVVVVLMIVRPGSTTGA
ncbi:hypothetical protein [Spirillospora sp. CA-294931]|uniref:hypothetical protein n=1 Tax=Spirillospora sp. CA-294931 TaxID=3240042 RepID=UPI003D93D04D